MNKANVKQTLLSQRTQSLLKHVIGSKYKSRGLRSSEKKEKQEERQYKQSFQ